MTHHRRPPRPHDLLPTSRPRTASAAARELVAGRRVLVTGAAGAVGSAVVRRVIGLGPAAVHLLDVDEARLHAQQLALAGAAGDPHVLLADVRDARALDSAFTHAAPDVVVHAAALQHVGVLERFACAAVMTNVWGTQNVVRAAQKHGVRTLLHVSSGHAADPVSVLGATQRLAERVVRGGDGLRAASVRWGTTLGERQPFWDALAHQVDAGLPVTVPDPDATRTCTTADEAAALLLEVATLADGGATYLVDAGERVRLVDLAHRYAALAGLAAPEVTVTGLGPGERRHDVLVGADERHHATGLDGVRRCPPVTRTPGFERVLSHLYAAADDADDTQVRELLAQQFGGLRVRVGVPLADQVPGGQVPGDQVPGGQVPGGQVPGGQVPGDQVPASGAAPALRVLGPVPA